jgi:hypothetical protein
VAVTGLQCARFVVGGGVTTPPPMLTCLVSGRSVEDAPTETVFTPGALVHTPFQYWKVRAQRDRHVLCLAGLSVTRWNPRRLFGGSPTPNPWNRSRCVGCSSAAPGSRTFIAGLLTTILVKVAGSSRSAALIAGGSGSAGTATLLIAILAYLLT